MRYVIPNLYSIMDHNFIISYLLKFKKRYTGVIALIEVIRRPINKLVLLQEASLNLELK